MNSLDKPASPTATDSRTDSAIRFAIGECSLGSVLVEQNECSICSILLGDETDTLARDLLERESRT